MKEKMRFGWKEICKSAHLIYTKEILTMPHNNQQLALYPTWVSDRPGYTTTRENVAVILQ